LQQANLTTPICCRWLQKTDGACGLLPSELQTFSKGQIYSIFTRPLTAGNGRDLKYAQNQLNLRAISVDNSKSFVEIVQKLEAEGKLEHNSIVLGDMCDLSMFENNTFDAIRHNASLLHMPVIAPGVMADKAISECYRVIKSGGILFIFVKEGEGVGVVDTGEGLGERFYQFFTTDLLRSLLERNKFNILEISQEKENRGGKTISWLAALATKNE